MGNGGPEELTRLRPLVSGHVHPYRLLYVPQKHCHIILMERSDQRNSLLPTKEALRRCISHHDTIDHFIDIDAGGLIVGLYRPRLDESAPLNRSFA